CQKYSLFPFTF
nr:immunoglobulin light chain junction region [Macaca mulatta]